jgi:hypothetical protein
MATAMEKPLTDEWLARWLFEVTGFSFARRASCPDHDAPFQWISDVYFGREPRVAVMGSRGSGKTLGSACLHWATGATVPLYTMAHFGGTMNQALQCQAYVKGISAREGLGGVLLGEPLAESVKWRNGSSLSIHTATVKQASGSHPQRKQADEFDLWDWDVYQKFLGMGAERAGTDEAIQTLFTSTRSKKWGLMHNLVKDADKRGIRVYRYCVWDVKAECPDCLKAKCELWEHCQGKHQNSQGHISRATIVDKALQMDTQTMRTELFCEEPSALGMCWPMFDPIPREGSNVSVAAEYRPDWPVFWGCDDNYEQPACIGIFQEDPNTGFLHCVDEYYRPHRMASERIEDIYGDTMRYPYAHPEFAIPDATASELAGALQRAGIPTFAPKNYKRAEGVKVAARWIRDARGARMLILHPRCTNIIRSMGAHHLKELPAGPDGVAMFSDEAEKHSDDHGADVVQYVCWVKRHGG